MASPSVARRTARPAVDPDDAFAVRAAELRRWASSNARAIMIGAVAALVVVGGFLAYRISQSRAAERASQAFLELQQRVSTADSVQGRALLQNFAQTYDGTVEGAEARLELGQRLLLAGQPKQAIPHFREVAGSGLPVAFQGKTLLAAALSRDGQQQQAIQTLLDAADDAEYGYQEQEALGEVALLHEQANNWRAAADIYRRMVENTEKGSLERSIAELRLAEAEARAGTAAPAAARP